MSENGESEFGRDHVELVDLNYRGDFIRCDLTEIGLFNTIFVW